MTRSPEDQESNKEGGNYRKRRERARMTKEMNKEMPEESKHTTYLRRASQQVEETKL